jgi:lipopolysaccharide biosynthesis protein
MFAGRVDPLRHLIQKSPTPESYEPEVGQVDATLAHAMERFLSLFVKHQGYALDEVPGDTTSAPAFGYQDSRPASDFSTTLDQKIMSLSRHNNP